MKEILNNGLGKVEGLFTFSHLIYVMLAILIICFFVFFDLKKDKALIEKKIIIIGIVLWILEIIKILFNLFIRETTNISNFVPLYFCSLYLFFVIFCFFKNRKIKEIGYKLIAYNCLVPGIAFIFYPITALNLHPLIHFLSFHSLFYHAMLVYTSLIIIIKKLAIFKFSDCYINLLVGGFFCLLAYIINYNFDTFFMFINKPPKDNYPLLFIEKIFKNFYPFVVGFGQVFGSFILTFLFIKIYQKRSLKNDKNN